MKKTVRCAVAAAGVSLTSLMAATPVAAYPVDCAILLCFAGGWPASAECSNARAVLIQRITPWPVEPPLQIWNCPMRVSARNPAVEAELFAIGSMTPVPVLPDLSRSDLFLPLDVTERADVDISDVAFDFVRSIRLFQISYSQRLNNDRDCIIRSKVIAGSYGSQGEYRSGRSSILAVPKASDLDIPANCRGYSHRSVVVEWRDYNGVYGHEEVHY